MYIIHILVTAITLARYGVVHASQTWFQSYLSNLMQSVFYGGTLSKWGAIHVAVPHGVDIRPFVVFYLH